MISELMRRASRLIEQDGTVISQDERELILTGWAKWPIIMAEEHVNDITHYITVYYDLPAPVFIASEDPVNDAHPDSHEGTKYLPEIIDALRRRMLLDDLADV